MTPSGRHECDRCAADLGNGGVDVCAVVSDLDPDGGVRSLHFCRDRQVAGETVRGCVRKLLSPSMLTAYTARHRATQEAPLG